MEKRPSVRRCEKAGQLVSYCTSAGIPTAASWRLTPSISFSIRSLRAADQISMAGSPRPSGKPASFSSARARVGLYPGVLSCGL